MRTLKALLLGTALLTVPTIVVHAPAQAAGKARSKAAQVTAPGPYQHVLIISIDGMHQLDMSNYLRTAYLNSNKTPSMLLQLSNMGTVFTNAWTPIPSNNFPGTLAITTGGTPASTGVWYDDSYDRSLYAPGSNCSGNPATEVNYTQFIDLNPFSVSTQIDPTKLPLRLSGSTCTPVYPHAFLQTNTIFEAVHTALPGGRTAWEDDHPSYDILNGNSGTGVDDLYTPELNAFITDFGAATLSAAEQYDTLKVSALLNEINGQDSSGQNSVGVPIVFGMNFKSLEAAQRTPKDSSVSPALVGGYKDSIGTPNTMVAAALSWIDGQIGSIVERLSTDNLMSSTLIIITAKYGDAPINARGLVRVDPTNPKAFTDTIDHYLGVSNSTPNTYFGAFDDAATIWLNPQYRTQSDTQQLAYWFVQQHSLATHLDYLLNWQAFKQQYGVSPWTDNRTPDLVMVPFPDVLYVPASEKEIAAHGGYNDDDLNIALMVAASNMGAATNTSAVTTAQIAPTVMNALGIAGSASLDSVEAEGTPALPVALP